MDSTSSGVPVMAEANDEGLGVEVTLWTKAVDVRIVISEVGEDRRLVEPHVLTRDEFG